MVKDKLVYLVVLFWPFEVLHTIVGIVDLLWKKLHANFQVNSKQCDESHLA